MRVPGIVRWPGTVPADTVSSEIVSSLDLLPTFVTLAGGEVPTDRVIDGVDQTAFFTGKGPSARDTMFYYRGPRLMAVRHGAFKAHFITQSGYGGEPPEDHDPPLLYNLEHDASERFDVAQDHPEVIERIRAIVAEHQANLEPGEPQLEKLIQKGD